mmetsp:Transcript_36734/g.65711  ORF Transcript_36734/g.65711 Transcript_36734/m.65711 type:complete len:225 (-) Transcript_36734:107-781(-)
MRLMEHLVHVVLLLEQFSHASHVLFRHGLPCVLHQVLALVRPHRPLLHRRLEGKPQTLDVDPKAPNAHRRRHLEHVQRGPQPERTEEQAFIVLRTAAAGKDVPVPHHEVLLLPHVRRGPPLPAVALLHRLHPRLARVIELLLNVSSGTDVKDLMVGLIEALEHSVVSLCDIRVVHLGEGVVLQLDDEDLLLATDPKDLEGIPGPEVRLVSVLASHTPPSSCVPS